uniref:homogentisate 1,2-dioxygenase n=1 Tax=Aegilops tauschii subsp. strangulata TaxID=200361 RepID=A0A453Q9P7_AEGTS
CFAIGREFSTRTLHPSDVRTRRRPPDAVPHSHTPRLLATRSLFAGVRDLQAPAGHVREPRRPAPAGAGAERRRRRVRVPVGAGQQLLVGGRPGVAPGQRPQQPAALPAGPLRRAALRHLLHHPAPPQPPWMYRIKPSVTHDPFHPRDPPNPRLLADFHDPRAAVATPTQLRWRPRDADKDADLDFVDGLYTVCGAGSSFLRHGFAVHMYAANKSMDGCAFCNADGDFLIVPQQGSQSSGLRPVKFRHNALSFCTYQPVALFMLDWNYLTYPAAQPPFGITNQ